MRSPKTSTTQVENKKGSVQEGYNDIRPTKNCHLLQLRPFAVPWAFNPGFI
jgi:hypothetical protein